jgi:hypothetical protein
MSETWLEGGVLRVGTGQIALSEFELTLLLGKPPKGPVTHLLVCFAEPSHVCRLPVPVVVSEASYLLASLTTVFSRSALGNKKDSTPALLNVGSPLFDQCSKSLAALQDAATRQ